MLLQESGPLDLHFPRESLKLHSRTESSSKAAFLDHSETLWMRSAAAWWGYMHALKGMVDVTCRHLLLSSCPSNTERGCRDWMSLLLLKMPWFVRRIDVDYTQQLCGVACSRSRLCCFNPCIFLTLCLRRDAGFTGLLSEIANSDAEGMWDIKVLLYSQTTRVIYWKYECEILFFVVFFKYRSGCQSLLVGRWRCSRGYSLFVAPSSLTSQ